MQVFLQVLLQVLFLCAIEQTFAELYAQLLTWSYSTSG